MKFLAEPLSDAIRGYDLDRGGFHGGSRVTFVAGLLHRLNRLIPCGVVDEVPLWNRRHTLAAALWKTWEFLEAT